MQAIETAQPATQLDLLLDESAAEAHVVRAGARGTRREDAVRLASLVIQMHDRDHGRLSPIYCQPACQLAHELEHN